MRLRLASRNEHKLSELAAALAGWEIELLGAAEFPPEEGQTYYDNARSKARFGRSLTDGWVLGEDSGIEVDALGGRPGVASARWAGESGHVAKLLDALGGVENRRARYVCELVCLSPDGKELRARGMLEGRVADEPRGSEGFGYDPIFIPDGEARTVAELGNAWKRANSHRARAAAGLREAVHTRC